MSVAPEIEPRSRKEPSMACEFLGWDKPILHSACEYLERRYERDGLWDMDQVVVVLPSSLAGRRLGELLAEVASKKNLVMRPPEIVTVGKLPEYLYQARFPFASDLVQVLCWAKVLRQATAEQLQPLLMEIPSRESLKPWIDLARMLSGLHRELATDLMLFTDVADRLKGTREEPRWRVLQKLQRKYLDELDKLHLWDIQTARRVAIDRGEPKSELDIIVLGAVDMNRAQRRFMDAVADRVTVLIGAPESWKDGFDPHGALQTDFWENLKVTVDPDLLFVRGTPGEAATEVVRRIAALPETYTTQDVTLGVPDPELVPILIEQLDRADIAARFGPGVTANQSPPVRLIDSIRNYLQDADFASFAVLVRAPIVARMLRSVEGIPDEYLQVLDRYYHATLIPSINIARWPEEDGVEVVRKMIDTLDQWLEPLRGESKSLLEWANALQTVLLTVYGEVAANAEKLEDAALLDACSHLNEAMTELADVPEPLRVEASLGEAVAWIQNLLDKARIPPLANPCAIEMLGWLELALDDTPALILTGLHDGVVPESVNADPFLPNGLRKELGLMDNSRRYARDCYVLQTMLHARKHLSIVVNQQSRDGSPQTPSRLLLAVPAEELGKRVLYLLKNQELESLPDVLGRWQSELEQSEIPIPLPYVDGRPTGLAVTEFRKYIDCPYRYYLSQVEKLHAIDDASNELGPDGFGNLIHDCLAGLEGLSQDTLADAEALGEWLFDQLDAIVKDRFGLSVSSPVQIQIEQARARLRAFAIEQARRTKEGWTIFATERSISKEAGICLKSGDWSIPILGRIDRIDFHPKNKTWAVWDYKTSDNAKLPFKAHFSDRESAWADLQLPLYRHLIRAIKEIGKDDQVTFGYINLPKSVIKTGFEIANFTPEQFRSADARAVEIARDIWNGIFLPVNMEIRGDWDVFAGICQTQVARRWERTLPGPQPIGSSQNRSENQPGDANLVSTNIVSTNVVQTNIPPATVQAASSTEIRQRLVDLHPDSIPIRPYPIRSKVPVDWFDPLLIRASAGTGKTYQLALRMLKLLFAEQSLDNVLATTFTRKAAGEILQRVMERLAKAACEDGELKSLKEALKPVAVTRQNCEYQLVRLCSQLHRFRVSTLDAFYLQLAKSFSLELQLPTGWSLADPFMESQLKDIAISRMFETQDRTRLRTLVSMLHKGDLGRSVRAEIRTVVSEGYKFFRVTTEEAWKSFPVIAAPSEDRFQDAVERFRTFPFEKKPTLKAQATLMEALLAMDWAKVVGATIVANCASGLEKFGSEDLTSEMVDALTIIGKKAAHEELLLRKFQLEASYELLAAYHEQLEWAKRQSRLVTFDDISIRLSKWLDQIQKKPADSHHGAIAEYRESIDFRLDARIDHLLLDEFQDTSPIQWNIVRPFAEAISREEFRRNTSFFCVGDTKQAIYGWRGGVAQIFDSVGQQLAGVKEAFLEQSRRSSMVIMNFVNTVFTNLSKHESKSFGDGTDLIPEWEARFPKHSTAQELPGFVVLKNGPKPKKKGFDSSPQDSDGEEGADEELMAFAADDIAMVASMASEKSIGVLVRRNVDVARMIYLLRERKVDASQEGGNPLTDSAAVELLLSLLTLADHPGNSIVGFHLQRSPLLAYLSCDPRREPSRLAEEVRQRIASQGYGATMAWYANGLATYCSSRDQQRLEQLIQLGYRYDNAPSQRVRDFVEFVRQERVAMPHPGQVRVMTIHQSKGLEFDAVFLPDLDQRIVGMAPQFVARYKDRTSNPTGVAKFVNAELRNYLPRDWQEVFQEYAKQQLAESLCVFYVALTRAKQALYMYSTPHSGVHGEWGSVLHSILVDDKEARNAPKETIYRDGDEKWYQKKEAPVKEKNSLVQLELGLTDAPPVVKKRTVSIRLRRPNPANLARLRPTTKPSAAGEDRIVALSKVLQRGHSVGAIIGTLVHRWFEEVKWIDDFHWDRDRMRSLGLATLTPQEMSHIQIEDWLNEMERMLQLSSVKQALSKDRYNDWKGERIDRLDVTNERRLLEIMDGSLLRGTIDRLVLGYRDGTVVRAEVLDYKTDSYADSKNKTSWLQERMEHHRPQLELYRRVLCNQFSIEPQQVGLSLIMLSSDSLIAID